jgi:hypothetical protein
MQRFAIALLALAIPFPFTAIAQSVDWKVYGHATLSDGPQ